MENINHHRKIGTAIFLAVLFLATFLFMKTISEIKAYGFIGGGVPSSNTITVSGTGEAFAVPDTATFSFSVVEEDESVAKAQDTATKKMNIALALLEKADIEEKDIKTTGYNIHPQYDYVREICTAYSCPPGKRELRGYQVSQTISVKVRETGEAGQILADIGSVGVTNVSGLNFTVDDEDEPKRVARKDAIKDAETKAIELANDLGVRLVRVVSFNESGGNYYPKRYDMAVMEMAADGAVGGAVPEIPVGENKITSNVSITYEIR
jgi:uncharacterized protein YggE